MDQGAVLTNFDSTQVSSGGRCLFLLARIQDGEGHDMARQISAKITSI